MHWKFCLLKHKVKIDSLELNFEKSYIKIPFKEMTMMRRDGNDSDEWKMVGKLRNKEMKLHLYEDSSCGSETESDF